MKKHDGWTFKASYSKHDKPFILPQYFQFTREEVIEKFERDYPIKWKDFRRNGHLKLVKVKVLEVT